MTQAVTSCVWVCRPALKLAACPVNWPWQIFYWPQANKSALISCPVINNPLSEPLLTKHNNWDSKCKICRHDFFNTECDGPSLLVIKLIPMRLTWSEVVGKLSWSTMYYTVACRHYLLKFYVLNYLNDKKASWPAQLTSKVEYLQMSKCPIHYTVIDLRTAQVYCFAIFLTCWHPSHITISFLL